MIIDPYQWRTLAITHVSHAASDTVAIHMKRPEDYTFKAGQYAVIRVTAADGKQYVRQYSFSSAPRDPDLELLIQHEPNGSASTWFFKTATEGDVIEVSQPFGGFTWKGSDRPTVMIAGRVGVAPFLSMLRSHPDAPHKLLYSVRNPDQICYGDELETRGANIIVTSVMGRINPHTLRSYSDELSTFYICGSKQFVDGITSHLQQLGVRDHDIQRELFTLQ